MVTSAATGAGVSGVAANQGTQLGVQGAQQGASTGFLSSTGARIGALSTVAAVLLLVGLLLTRLGRHRYRAAHRA